MNVCWICKQLIINLPSGRFSFTGRCISQKCRSIEGISFVEEDGSLVNFPFAKALKKGQFQEVQLIHQSKRFADDTGWYHQFNGGNKQ